MERYVIRGGNRLEGTVRIGGAKNSILPILAAVLLNNSQDEVILKNVPRIRDVVKMVEILSSLGAKITWSGSDMVVSTKDIQSYFIDERLMREMRSTIFLMGALLGRFGQACISHPGGCAIGQRPIGLHTKGLAALGVQFREQQQGYIYASGTRMKGADIHLDYPSVGATENIMMAAVYARGTTLVSNAAKEPEIVDLQNILNQMGAKIRGAGTDQIRIDGVTQLHGVEYSVIPDRIVAGTIMMAAANTGGDVLLENVIPGHLDAVISKLRETGAQIREENDRLRIQGPERPKAVEFVRTLPYPGFPTDLQAPMMALLTRASGTSIVIENVFDSRFKHVGELTRMGANIIVTSDNRTAVIHGVKHLTGASVTASDLRAGAALMIAGLCAEGETVVDGLQHVSRGYENLDEELIRLGADIKHEKG
ncbi:MAG: UDP-N-acetylglucosamine 1-carboxyvinyltransferase [Bacillota bacterium]|nr:UDP-N-acetylglucosamine 1-carboxyvinyltransferase [Bacillota bacterium]MDW7684014.1 UDP-N-acetylglucosamine 1-carboxyvinyltransferase [Bacillota bacterium]